MALRRPGACRHPDGARGRKELERSIRVLGVMPSPGLVQRKNRERSCWHGYVDFASRQLRLCFAEKKCDCHCFLRSEEHTSELQSPMYIVCRLLLEKKKKILS